MCTLQFYNGKLAKSYCSYSAFTIPLLSVLNKPRYDSSFLKHQWLAFMQNFMFQSSLKHLQNCCFSTCNRHIVNVCTVSRDKWAWSTAKEYEFTLVDVRLSSYQNPLTLPCAKIQHQKDDTQSKQVEPGLNLST